MPGVRACVAVSGAAVARAISAAELNKRLHVDLEMELARLHGHITKKRAELMAALEAAGTEATVVASRRLKVVLDELDVVSARVRDNEGKVAGAAAMARDRAGVTVFY